MIYLKEAGGIKKCQSVRASALEDSSSLEIKHSSHVLMTILGKILGL